MVYVWVELSSQPRVTNRAMKALSRPAPVMAGMMGWKMPAMAASTLLRAERLSSLAALGSSTGAADSKPHRAMIS